MEFNRPTKGTSAQHSDAIDASLRPSCIYSRDQADGGFFDANVIFHAYPFRYLLLSTTQPRNNNIPASRNPSPEPNFRSPLSIYKTWLCPSPLTTGSLCLWTALGAQLVQSPDPHYRLVLLLSRLPLTEVLDAPLVDAESNASLSS